jgi:hypothetical protein
MKPCVAPFSAPHHIVTDATVRWPVACLAAVVPLLTLVLMFYSGRPSRSRSAEAQAATPHAPARMDPTKPAVPFSGYDTSRRVSDDARAPVRNIVRPGLPPRSPVPQPSIRPPVDNKPHATVELTGIIGLPGRTKALLEIAEPGFGRTVNRVVVQAGERVDSIEVVQIDVAKDQVTIRNAGVESVLSLKTPQPVAGAATSPAGATWPPLFGDLNGDLELRIKNPNEFNVRVGVRSDGKGKDFYVPAYGTQSVFVPPGFYATYFQYSNEPQALYQGDNVPLFFNGSQITITKVVNGNYGIRKVNP